MSYFHSHHLERFGLKLSRSLSERGAALTFLRGAGGKEDLARSDHSEKQAMFDPFGHLGGGVAVASYFLVNTPGAFWLLCCVNTDLCGDDVLLGGTVVIRPRKGINSP